MPFCGSCGAQVDGRFCPKCGAPVAAGASAPPPTPSGPAADPYAAPVSAPMADNVASALCYLAGLITGVIFLVLEPYSKNRAIKFHAFQSIFMNLVVIVVDIVLSVFFHAMISVFGLFGLLAGLVWPLFGLGCLALWLYMLISTYQGKTVVLPVIGPIAQKQAQS
jgi:uncharacterized membrane protein